jgi:hypothetical protein
MIDKHGTFVGMRNGGGIKVLGEKCHFVHHIPT